VKASVRDIDPYSWIRSLPAEGVRCVGGVLTRASSGRELDRRSTLEALAWCGGWGRDLGDAIRLDTPPDRAVVELLETWTALHTIILAGGEDVDTARRMAGPIVAAVWIWCGWWHQGAIGLVLAMNPGVVDAVWC